MAKKNNTANKPVYKNIYNDFDDEVIPDDFTTFILEGGKLKRNKDYQSIEDKGGNITAIKCPRTKKWCKGTMECAFGCVGCIYYNTWPVTESSKKEAVNHPLHYGSETIYARETPAETKSDFTKNDSGKLQWSLLPFEQLEDVVRVLMAGAEKYSRDNWKKCDDINRYKDSLMRHVTAYIKGNKFDNEPGGDNLHHLAHAICNCLFILFFDKGDIEEWNQQLNEKMSV